MNQHEKLNYIEFPARDLEKTKRFFSQVFNWQFTDFGPNYTAFSDQGLDGGFYKSELSSLAENGAALAIFYSTELEATLEKITQSGGIICKDIFTFPGGRRFHFIEPSGNEFAVLSDR